jgi:hypothetical protein
MSNNALKVNCLFQAYRKHRKVVHRTPSSLRGRLDTNNLRTSKTIIMNQSIINFGTMHIILRMTNYVLLDGA